MTTFWLCVIFFGLNALGGIFVWLILSFLNDLNRLDKRGE